MKDKIKVTKEIKEYEGNVTEKVVTPFGSSGHIIIGKEFIGRVLPVIEPSEPELKWILPDDALKHTIKTCNDILREDNSKMAFHKRSAVDRLKNKFSINDINLVVTLLGKTKNNQNLVDLIKKTYSL